MGSFLNRYQLTARLWLGTAALWLAFGATLGVGLWGLHAARTSLREVHDARMVPMGELGDLRTAQLSDVAEMLRLIQHAPGSATAALHDHPAQTHIDNVLSRRSAIDWQWAGYLASVERADERQLAERADAARRAWLARLDATLAAVRQGDYTPATIAAFLQASRTEGQATLDQLAELEAFQEKTAAAEALAASQRYERALRLFAACALLGALPATVAIGLTLRRQAAGFRGAQAAAQAIAEGDLARPIPPDDAHDEVGRLSLVLRAMQQRLLQTVTGVRGHADQVATASAQIAQGNQDLSQRTEQQAAALQQTASAMEQLAATVRHTADNASQADQLAAAASSVARQGGQVVGEVVETMRGIDEASQRIADIIGVIDGIAFQTNILALNAAVEAARAGEQGRGFAVVAAEVRALAQRSAAAAREIKSLIGTSVTRVEQGNAQVSRAGATMQEVVSAIQRVGDIVGEISRAAAEQRQGVVQTGETVMQMDQATQQNAALVEQTAAAAESLRTQAGQLVDAVAVFRTGGHGEPATH